MKYLELELQIVNDQWMIKITGIWMNLLEMRHDRGSIDWREGLLEFMLQEERKLYLEE